MPKTLSGLPYLGGKNANDLRGLGRWINSLLPPSTRETTYIEPYAGMLGVLLSRPKAGTEVANDLDGLIVNWWRVVRDQNEALAYKVEHTGRARAEYEQALEELHNPDPVISAWAVTTVLGQSIDRTTASAKKAWRLEYVSHDLSSCPSFYANKIRSIKDRIEKVYFENKDALELLADAIKYDRAIIYCDPVYASDKPTFSYRHNDTQHQELTSLLTGSEVQAKVAISGYQGDFESLKEYGWLEHTRSSWEAISRGKTGATKSKRTECLWTNYQPNQQLTLGA